MREEPDGGAQARFDPYGADARELLGALRQALADAVPRYVESVLARIEARQPDAGASVHDGGAAPQASRLLHERHLHRVLEPAATRGQVVAAGESMGVADALAGLDSALLADACSACVGMFAEQATRVLPAGMRRVRATLIVTQRLLDDLNGRIAGLTRVVRAYQQEAIAALPAAATPWSEFVDRQMKRLVELPGIVGCAMTRPDAQGVFRIEAFAGHGALRVFLDGEAGDVLPRLDARVPQGQGIVAPAWRDASIVHAGSYGDDPRTAAWRRAWETARRQVEVASSVAIPVLDRGGHTVNLLLLYGSAAHQFTSSAMRVFVEGLQRRFGAVWEQAHYLRPVQLVREDQARRYRERLFAGGLEMFVQPIVDLRDGRVGKVEALARLRCEDGSVLSPALFLPLLGETELHWLFRQGLEQSLGWLARWEADGAALEVSLNLPPSALVDPRCSDWVRDALRRHGLPAHRLTLELLETQHLDPISQEQAIDGLSRLGVRLAMDDLGAGYSSLKRLASSRFDLIKIDQDLFRHLRAAPLNTLNLVGSLVHLGRDYDCEVVVEGLEDRGMIEVAAVLGAGLGQGWGLGRPMEPDRLPGWLRLRGAPPRAHVVTTPIGALASAWDHVRHGAVHGRAALACCALTGYLSEQGDGARRARELHAALHRSGPSRQERGEILDWFVEQALHAPAD